MIAPLVTRARLAWLTASAALAAACSAAPTEYPLTTSSSSGAGTGFQTDVFHYKPSDGTTTNVKTVQFEIVGAGVSTCAPIKPPN